MNRFGILLLCLTAFSTLQAQIPCGGGRYLRPIFPSATVSSDITYGSNFNLQGNLQSLELDIYEPTGDAAALRPLILFEHGGSFMFGDKAGTDVPPLAEPLAKMGYVVASIEYRLGMEGMPFPGPDSGKASEAVWRAVSDYKAAVRWFYKSVKDGSNPYRIDTNHIFIGGVSAGAIAAVHYAYLDQDAEIPSFIDTTKVGLGGGLEGSSGNLGYSTRVKAVVSVCGMLADTAWIQPGDEPIVSLHGTNDDVVPYGTDIISVVSVFPIFEVDGSASVHQRATQMGIDNCLYTHYGAAHTPHVFFPGYTDTTLAVISNFLYGYTPCGASTCTYIVGREDASEMAAVTLSPNPSQGSFQLEVPAAWKNGWQYEIMDLSGRSLVKREGIYTVTADVHLQHIAAGLYLVEATDGQTRRVLRLVID
jgi:para-nitrobenzyl esterase